MTAVRVASPVRRRVEVRGVVQGVGFRPHLARLAARLELDGWCRNEAGVVVLEVEGSRAAVDAFVRGIAEQAPPLARVDSVREVSDVPLTHVRGFGIVASTAGDGERTTTPPDTAVCETCLAEMCDPTARRFRHPFVTCTDCGPRYSITLDLPYDRARTTMAGFEMCDACAGEYGDPLDRRFHAQPLGCHDCGPTLRALAPGGVALATGNEASLAAAVEGLASGSVVAVKGLGGFHLACDATSESAVAALRERKHRPDQPFAVMVADLAAVARLVEVGGAAPVLSAPDRPIVLLPARASNRLAAAIAPGLDEVGVFLPYTPLHHLLLADLAARGGAPALVMTSANLSGEPLCYRDEDAVRLDGLVDLVLTHDREIAVPVEDSVVAWSEETGPVPVRRSRGRAPAELAVADASTVVLAAGAELKNTVALARGGRVYLSAHVGDLSSLEGRETHARVADRLMRFHRASPDVVVGDLHPAYASRAWARRTADALGLPMVGVQHHHAHLASLAAEHGRLSEPILGAVLDGTGYGCDGGVWGFELMLLRDGGRVADRLGHLGDVALFGGDEGVRNPVRTAALALLAAGEDLVGTPVAHELGAGERSLLERGARSGAGIVPTSSAGRLFDVASSLLGVRHRCTYDAQAAIELEAAARAWRRSADELRWPPALALPVSDGPDGLLLDPRPTVRDLVSHLRSGRSAGSLAWAFHEAVAAGLADALTTLARRHDLGVVGLTGGVFVNRLLLAATRERLLAAGLEVLTHQVVPANDGGISLGQAVVGRALTSPSVS